MMRYSLLGAEQLPADLAWNAARAVIPLGLVVADIDPETPHDVAACVLAHHFPLAAAAALISASPAAGA